MWLILFFMAWAQTAPAAPASSALDFDTYKTKVEPLLLEKRPGHARCVVCHASAGRAFRLQPLPSGSATWTEEQSRRNFEMVSRLVVPDDPQAGLLLTHPLAPEAGGLLTTDVALGARVTAGAQLARIHDVYGDLVETITAPQDGHFVRSTTFSAVAAGERVATLGLE